MPNQRQQELNWSKLEFSTDLKEIGPEYPQAGPCKSYNFKGAQSYLNINHNKFPDFVPDLNYFEIHPRAPFTDVVSSGLSFGMIINQKIKSLIESFSTIPTRYYPMQLKRNKEIREYYLMHPISSFIEYIDFKKTKFFVDNLGQKEMELEISSCEELKEMRAHYIDQRKFISSSIIFLIPEFADLKLDLFIIAYSNHFINISESLKARLIQEKVTGVEISKSNVKLSP